MTVSVKFEAEGGGSPLSKLAALVDDLEQRGGAVGPYVEVIAEEMVSRVIERFELESGHEQGPWPKSNFKHRRRQAANNRLLRDTGILFGSIVGASYDNVAEAFTNVPYAAFHASPEPRSKIPLRDFMDIDRDAVAEYAIEVITAAILEL